MNRRGIDSKKQLQISIYVKHDTVMPSHNKQVQAIVKRLMTEKGIQMVFDTEIVSIKRKTPGSSVLMSKNGTEHAFDEAICCTSAHAQSWLSESGLETTKEGFVCVSTSLESTNTPNVFACGDVCHLVDNPRPKAGVFAVRAGPPLLVNLQRRLLGEALEPWAPQDQFLGIIHMPINMHIHILKDTLIHILKYVLIHVHRYHRYWRWIRCFLQGAHGNRGRSSMETEG